MGGSIFDTNDSRYVKPPHPANRIAQPDEIAPFLLSDEASFLADAALARDGGFTAR